MTRWVISDTHFGHANMLKFKSSIDGKSPLRDFDSIEEHDECIFDNWADAVKPQDHIYHLGDVTLERGGKAQQVKFIKLIRSLPGHKRLFLGNHDHFDAKVYLMAGFEKLFGTWKDHQTDIIFSHFPLHPSTVGSVRANVHGHIHDHNSPACASWINRENGELHITPFINVSCEKTDYKPLPFEELETRIKLAIEKFKADEEVRV